ncbi:hypothetical protein OIU34_18340 [Pararhizobium sp. BT-229]|uniref:hypothetical protein n=1 Tax=Pararhizobium sp. BT-229 TaxID=2986923 RepID=UPI0021F746E0|nr:hypothetical protein [Pararhizobium sp. BT-229]MCV9963839.1 hypothetical protein [Pararhizobium sp. BT-229]
MFVQAFKAAVAYRLRNDKPSEFGPRMLDGNWVRTYASPELHARILDCQIADEGLEQAFLSGVGESPAPAATCPSP